MLCVSPAAKLVSPTRKSGSERSVFLSSQVETKDALLHAINEEYVEAVEVLLEHEESVHKEGELHVSNILPATMSRR